MTEGLFVYFDVSIMGGGRFVIRQMGLLYDNQDELHNRYG
jgi:hypothetical protein